MSAKTADVVIIGGGIVGCCIAAEFAKNLNHVVLVEKNDINMKASSSNFGMVWIQTRFPGFDTAMAKKSQAVYEKKIAEGEFDIDIEYEKRGGLTIAYNDIQMEALKMQCAQKQKGGTPMAVIGREDTLRLEPNLNPEIVGSIFCAEDARVNPLMTALAFANLAKRRGAEIICRTEVTGIKVSGQKVTGVKTTKGDIDAPIVINAAGVWARPIAKMVGIDLPVFPNRLQALVTEPMKPRLLSRIVQVARDIDTSDPNLDLEKAAGFLFEIKGEPTEENLPHEKVEDTIFTYIQQSLSDTVVIGTTNEFVGYDIRTTPKALYEIMKPAVKICPCIADANIIRTWASVIPFTFDGKPIVGKVDGLDGFILAAGHGHAMAHAPALAEQLADLLFRNIEDPLLKEASLKRFQKKASVAAV